MCTPVILVPGSLRPRGSQILVHPELNSKFQTILVYLTMLCQKIKKNKKSKNDFPVLCCNLFNMKPIQRKTGLELYSSVEFTCGTHGTWASFMYPRVNKTDSTGWPWCRNRMKHRAVSLKQGFSTVHSTTNIKSKCGCTEQWEYYSLTGHKRGQKIRGAGTVESEITD